MEIFDYNSSRLTRPEQSIINGVILDYLNDFSYIDRLGDCFAEYKLDPNVEVDRIQTLIEHFNLNDLYDIDELIR